MYLITVRNKHTGRVLGVFTKPTTVYCLRVDWDNWELEVK